MTPEFARAVDPIFMHVLDLLEQIERGDDPSAEDERRHVELLISEADAKLGQRDDWRLAKYGLVSWIDEMLILEAPWSGDGNRYWNQNKLETGLFDTNIRATQFYVEAGKATSLPKKDALEVYYIAVTLGYQGLYRAENAAAVAAANSLPLDLETWVSQTAKGIRVGQGREKISDTTRSPERAPPLDGALTLIWPSLAAVVLAAVSIAFLINELMVPPPG